MVAGGAAGPNGAWTAEAEAAGGRSGVEAGRVSGADADGAAGGRSGADAGGGSRPAAAAALIAEEGAGAEGGVVQGDAEAPGAGGAGIDVVLPEPVRLRVVALAAEALGRLALEQVPGPLRAMSRFTPVKRARLAAAPLALALDADPAFRSRVAEHATQLLPASVEAVLAGAKPDPIELAVAAYLLRPDGWQTYLDRCAAAIAETAEVARARERDTALDRLRAELDAAKAAAREEADRVREALAAAREEVTGLRRQLREQIGLRRAAERARTAADEALSAERRRAGTADSLVQAEVRRLRQRLTEAEDEVEAARRAARESRQVDQARLWLLLDTAAGAVQGLRRQLALTPTEERPADAVAASASTPHGVGVPGPAARGDDPGRLDRLLELPNVHLVVDGYNVTKSGYGTLPLDAQRGRLLRGLGALAARTRAEVSCVFDGAARPPAMAPAPRGVRVLFSPPGETADDLIRRLVAAEPPGRPVVVVSSDREVADTVRNSGATVAERLAFGAPPAPTIKNQVCSCNGGSHHPNSHEPGHRSLRIGSGDRETATEPASR